MSAKNATGGPTTAGIGTSNTSNSIPLTSNTFTTTTGNTYSFPNNNGWLGGGLTYTDSYINIFDFEDKCVDIEKLIKIDSEKRSIIMDLLLAFTKCDDYSTKKLIYNTLETYSVITDKDALHRKVKIANIISNDSTKKEL